MVLFTNLNTENLTFNLIYTLKCNSYISIIFPPTDLQNVNITLRILFRPITTQLPRIFTSIGEDYDERVLPSITTEVLKSVVVSDLINWPSDGQSDPWNTMLIWNIVRKPQLPLRIPRGIKPGGMCNDDFSCEIPALCEHFTFVRNG